MSRLFVALTSLVPTMAFAQFATDTAQQLPVPSAVALIAVGAAGMGLVKWLGRNKNK